MTQTEEQTPPCQTMTVKTSFFSPVNNAHHRNSQTSSCARSHPLVLCYLMYHHVLDREAFFGDHGVCSGVVRAACRGSATTIGLTVSPQAKGRPFLYRSHLTALSFHLTGRTSGLPVIPTSSSLMTSLPWPLPST